MQNLYLLSFIFSINLGFYIGLVFLNLEALSICYIVRVLTPLTSAAI